MKTISSPTHFTREMNRRTPDLAGARGLARDWALGLNSDTVWGLELVVSELVTNAVRHGEGTITMTLSMSGSTVHVAVHDDGANLPEIRTVEDSELIPGGRGLRLVNELSQSWGVASDSVGKTVWATL